MTTIGTQLFTRFRGEEVGKDDDGNRYFRQRNRAEGERERRWVIYADEVEASEVPPEWHAWLHHTIDAPPGSGDLPPRKPWQRDHHPNQTGSNDAYRPPGHVASGGQRDSASGDYEPWQP